VTGPSHWHTPRAGAAAARCWAVARGVDSPAAVPNRRAASRTDRPAPDTRWDSTSPPARPGQDLETVARPASGGRTTAPDQARARVQIRTGPEADQLRRHGPAPREPVASRQRQPTRSPDPPKAARALGRETGWGRSAAAVRHPEPPVAWACWAGQATAVPAPGPRRPLPIPELRAAVAAPAPALPPERREPAEAARYATRQALAMVVLAADRPRLRRLGL
jgi:hypothetical protein